VDLKERAQVCTLPRSFALQITLTVCSDENLILIENDKFLKDKKLTLFF